MNASGRSLQPKPEESADKNRYHLIGGPYSPPLIPKSGLLRCQMRGRLPVGYYSQGKPDSLGRLGLSWLAFYRSCRDAPALGRTRLLSAPSGPTTFRYAQRQGFPWRKGAGRFGHFGKLSQDLYRERVEAARKMPPEEKLLAGEELFEYACAITLAGIHNQFPEADEQQSRDILRQRLKLRERMERLERERD